ncbi:aminotransferase class V-fold PLP-dependent enzyme [Pseudonocardia humida]|uniref:Aminotransferase class V-fold PLP-dependent enzyme n=1 Tax=Pseudonocardia humida TaxID=2800819 RepID=A0ABT1A029_9PSEU|nr:aminotransferase class V-fold PLP-dependent enzyme [Pseudonocardia humida]MCO1656352.1 aminotransferase class V-fold PLP-dependent enzyme [Pseudonocardia humida]
MRQAFGEGFDVPDGYLDSAGSGVPPASAVAAVTAAVHDWRGGAVDWAGFEDAVAATRAAVAALTGFPADRVALGPAVSALVGLIAADVPDRAAVLVAEGEFTSVSWPFAVQRGRGVTVDEAPLERLGERAAGYDVVAVSVAQSADGRVVDLDALRAARAAGCRVVLDATQSLGRLDADLSWADAVVAAGYKWLLAPRGAAWLALGPDLDPVPHLAGWSAAEQPWDSAYGLPVRLARDARRLDLWSSMLVLAGAGVSVPWVAGLDRAAVHAHCVGLADAFREGLGMGPGGSAIVSVPGDDADDRLAAAGVVATSLACGARLAFALYNTQSDVDRALRALHGAS